MTRKDLWIARFVRRVRIGFFLRAFADWLAVWLIAFGLIDLGVKLFLPHFWPHVLWLGLSVIPVVLASWLTACRSVFSQTMSVAHVDRILNAGGLLMTLSEVSADAWDEHLPQAEQVWRRSVPAVRPVRFFRHVGLPLVFAAATGFVPLREASSTPVLHNTVGQQATGRLEEMLTQLDKTGVLDKEEEQQLREEIEKLADETEQTPLTHEKWEAVDTVQERLRNRLETAVRSISKTQAALSALGASSGDGPELPSEQMAQLQEDVANALRKMADRGVFSAASPHLQSELERMLKDGKFRLPQDPKQLQKVLDDLQGFLDQEFDRLSELRKQCLDCERICESCGKRHPGGT